MLNSIKEATEEMLDMNIDQVSKEAQVKAWLEYEGIIGYDSQIIKLIETVYGVELK